MRVQVLVLTVIVTCGLIKCSPECNQGEAEGAIYYVKNLYSDCIDPGKIIMSGQSEISELQKNLSILENKYENIEKELVNKEENNTSMEELKETVNKLMKMAVQLRTENDVQERSIAGLIKEMEELKTEEEDYTEEDESYDEKSKKDDTEEVIMGKVKKPIKKKILEV